LPVRRVSQRSARRFPEAAIEIARERARAIPAWHRTGATPSPFREALNGALIRAGLTLDEAAALADLSPRTVESWSYGYHTPFRDDLQRFAQTVGTPELVDLIESRHRRIHLTCRQCGRPRDAEPGEVRQYLKSRAPGRVTVDWDKGEGQDICRTCDRRSRFTTMHHNLAKRHGRKALRDRAKKHLGAWRKDNPDKQLKLQQAATAAAAATPKSPAAMARQRLGQFSIEPAGVFGLCALCHKLLFVWDADVRAKLAREGRHNVGRFHGACYARWQKTAENRAEPLPDPLKGRTTSEQWLATAYTATLMYFRQLVGSKQAFRDEDGQLRKIAWLSTPEGRAHAPVALSRKGLYKVVKQFLAYLPDEAVATGLVKSWREVFLMLGAHLLDAADEPNEE
jgi:hypothetical protein